MKKTTIILSTLLTASIIGNAVQYNKAPGGTATTIATQPVTDEPEGAPTIPEAPAAGAQDVPRWDTYATFAVTYKVEHKPGLVGGYTVTIYYPDHSPTTLRQAEKPTVAHVTWQPDVAGLPGIIEVKPIAVRARQFNPDGQ